MRHTISEQQRFTRSYDLLQIMKMQRHMEMIKPRIYRKVHEHDKRIQEKRMAGHH